MTIPKDAKCSAKKYSSWGASICGKPAKMQHDGCFYCGVHDPVKAQAKRDAQDVKWRAEREAARLARAAVADKQTALEQDAARYRYLRNNPDWETEMFLSGLTPVEFDAAIDAAMKAP